MHRHKRGFRRIIVLVILTPLAALLAYLCIRAIRSSQNQALLVQNSVLAGTPLPGWQGIVPGQTSQEEALNILQHSAYVRRDSINSESNPSTGMGGILWNSQAWHSYPSTPHEFQNIIWVTEGKVRIISIRLDNEYLRYDMTVEQAIAHFGAPERVARQVTEDAPGSVYTAIYLLYPSQGFALHCVGGYSLDQGLLIPASRVRYAYYFEPMTPDELRASTIGRTLYMGGSLDQMKDWAGYDPTPIP